ncbi:hypothetical protein K7Z75_18420 [Mycobacterium avium subsp. hominissuis]|uniref:DUF7461 family protein n=1 Tax=Mycobacterium avium TaxID=1764 RepID=UPI00293AB575|nr:hypothetical protein [Mycobacterium avium]MDV3305638.1 hypothetical protein [Mycobacterium avium subsp. hominissuis]
MDAEQIAALERKWKHASDVAFASIGQPDRAANVAYRDQLATELRAARGEADPTISRHL